MPMREGHFLEAGLLVSSPDLSLTFKHILLLGMPTECLWQRELVLGIQPGEWAFFNVACQTLEVEGQRGSGKLTQRKLWVVVVDCQQHHMPWFLGTDRKFWVVHSLSAIVNI